VNDRVTRVLSLARAFLDREDISFSIASLPKAVNLGRFFARLLFCKITMTRYLFVALGAAAGGLARYVIGTAIMQRSGGRFPLGTLVVNITGCFLVGVLMTMITERGTLASKWQPLLVVGVLGGYTTFSSFGWETYRSIREGHVLMGLAYVLLSVGLGYLAVWCGASLARR
jgi:CrcB protein